ncbi:MAG: type II 3-dehydroquinate dehydratase [Bacteroidetes bacterium]|nr:type II 3-dehydroquinate dehydratase [Bacteroidota bacterium]
MKILIINGPNLNMLGKRDAAQYGSLNLDNIESTILSSFANHEIKFFQSNLEGEIVEIIQTASDKYNAIVINPGGYSHTSVAIRDALELCTLPKIEVHLSNLASREDFRHTMITAAKCDGYISGFKENGYFAAIYLIEKIISK